MNWISALGPVGWTILLLVPPLILMLYFLKLRRTLLEVPSTYLWTRTIEDLHVNSIWQRLRNSLLLILQLLLALLLIVSCLRPGCDGEELAGDRFIFLIDNSASMSATDIGEDQSKSRLQEAKKQIENLIRRMKKGDAGMLISFSDRADVQQSYTTNQSLLLRKLREIKQTQRASDMKEALVAASGLANPGRTSDKESAIDIQVADAKAAKLYIFSDGGVPEVPSFSLGEYLTPEFHPIGSIDPPNNVGITAFSINDEMETENQIQAFARLQNSSDESRFVDVDLYIDGVLHDALGGVEVPKNDSKSLSYNLTGVVENLEKALPVKLEIKTPDVYAQDNVAYAVLNPPRLADVLVVREYNQFLEFALGTGLCQKLAAVEFQPPSYLDSPEYNEAADLGIYDLIIYDQCAPQKMPLCNTVFIGKLPPGDRWKAGDKQGPTPIIDTDRSHPIMYSVSLNNVTVIEAAPLTGPSGWTSLVDSTVGSILAIGPRGGFQDLVFGFGIIEFDESGDPVVNTDWPSELSFPLFVQNFLKGLGGGAKFAKSQAVRPGDLKTIKPQLPYPTVTVTSPSNTKNKLRPRGDNTFVYANTENSGIYEVQEPETNSIDQLFAVNLMDRQESNLRVRDSLDIGFEKVSGTVSDYKPVRKEYWPWLVGLALVILLFEWYVYNRRVFI